MLLMSEEIILSPNTYLRVTDENSFFQIEQNVLSFLRNLLLVLWSPLTLAFYSVKMKLRLRTAVNCMLLLCKLETLPQVTSSCQKLSQDSDFLKNKIPVACTRKLFMPIVYAKDVIVPPHTCNTCALPDNYVWAPKGISLSCSSCLCKKSTLMGTWITVFFF